MTEHPKQIAFACESLDHSQNTIAVAKFLWPGRDEWQHACARCIARARHIAEVLGFRLQEVEVKPIPIPGDTRTSRLEVE